MTVDIALLRQARSWRDTVLSDAGRGRLGSGVVVLGGGRSSCALASRLRLLLDGGAGQGDGSYDQLRDQVDGGATHRTHQVGDQPSASHPPAGPTAPLSRPIRSWAR